MQSNVRVLPAEATPDRLETSGAVRQRSFLRILWLITCPAVIVGSLLPATSTPMVLIGTFFNDKLTHLISYGWLAFLPVIRERPRTAIACMAAILAMGFLLELAQGLTPDRTFDMYDFAANTAGIACGGALGLWARFLASAQQPANSE